MPHLDKSIRVEIDLFRVIPVVAPSAITVNSIPFIGSETELSRARDSARRPLISILSDFLNRGIVQHTRFADFHK